MEEISTYFLTDCYGTLLCMAIIISFLFVYKKYDVHIIHYFVGLCTFVLVQNISSIAERFLGNQATYSPWRLFLSWVCYISGPATILIISELILRYSSNKIKFLIAVPEIVNVIVTSTCFFGPWCFTINPSRNGFEPGPLCIVPRAVPVIYIVILIIAAFANVRRSKVECIIVLVGSAFVLWDYYNEIAYVSPVSIREITIALTVMAYFMYFTAVLHIDEVQELNNSFAQTEERYTKEMVDQSIETLAFTIDAKDRYTKGHSSRVAKYSRMIAQLCGKSELECNQIYRAALLHDIGKISIKGQIINKAGKLTDEEYEDTKKHPEKGAKILEKMKSISYLQNGAKYHHERYDGTGYPVGLKGEDIPEYARIISVADAYDAMTSYRSYRQPMEQLIVKQEIWKGMGTQFDPKFAKLMISLIDADIYYEMRENPDIYDEIAFDNDPTIVEWKPKSSVIKLIDENTESENTFNSLGALILTEDNWDNPTESVSIDSNCRISFHAKGSATAEYVWCCPTIIVFSSDNGEFLGQNYDELAVLVSTGYSWRAGSAISENSTFQRKETFGSWDNWIEENKKGMDYEINVINNDDKLKIKIENEIIVMESEIVLPKDFGGQLNLTISGERCEITGIRKLFQ